MFRTNQILSPLLTLGHNTHNTTIVFDFSKLFFLDVRPNVVIVLKEKFSILFKHELCLHMDIWKTIKFQLKFITHVTIILIKKNVKLYKNIVGFWMTFHVLISALVYKYLFVYFIRVSGMVTWLHSTAVILVHIL